MQEVWDGGESSLSRPLANDRSKQRKPALGKEEVDKADERVTLRKGCVHVCAPLRTGIKIPFHPPRLGPLT